MSALTKLMVLLGKKVTGSDLVYNKELEGLIEWGVDVWAGHQPDKLADAELVVYTAAVPDTDPELTFAREHGIPAVVRHYFLGEIAKDFGSVIAVSGTHGKTTTTGMLAGIFEAAGEAYTAHIGGNIPNSGNLIYKGYDYFITEACEYKKSMLSLSPDIAVILNVEPDHPDTYDNIGELYKSFEEFIAKAKGSAVVNRDCGYYKTLKGKYNNLVTYGIGEDARIKAESITEYKNGYYGFVISADGSPVTKIRLSVPGHHNVYNALAAYAAAMLCGLSAEAIKKGIESFTGMERRFEIKGKMNKALVVVDYAHHPTEIKAVIDTAKSFRPSRILAVFQPHTYSRTKQLYNEFLSCFEKADKLYIFKEYPARETPEMGKTALDLYKGLRARKPCQYFGDIISLAKAISSQAAEGDIVLILGAGDIALLGELLLTTGR